MSEKRTTYKTETRSSKKPSRITFRISEEDQDKIRKDTQDAGFLSESEYLRYRLCFQANLTEKELQEIKKDLTFCREWIEQHKDEIETILTALHLILKLFS